MITVSKNLKLYYSILQTSSSAYLTINDVSIIGILNVEAVLTYALCSQVGHDLEDPRLKVMKREWFEGKDCLDIGCNSGLITIAIGKQFCTWIFTLRCTSLCLFKFICQYIRDLVL